MGIYQDPRMVALRAAQSRENAKLYDQFLRLHPELDGYIDRDDWTPAEDEAFREFAASVVHRHAQERQALVTKLGGKPSPLSEFQFAQAIATACQR
ncbi:hypothetical protein [Mycolicibacterium pallens]|uniref:Uncharacterized protein n=1 Tax=Mycolicibacterium pallens TaxID=370524 RepID=A0ABX8VN75_9MYCO|nr:hypothetical protein [Mycolicibacterium pallens]QYL19162.1 hypothetical protein K0O64_12120 [Mycolicibacterium pallens]